MSVKYIILLSNELWLFRAIRMNYVPMANYCVELTNPPQNNRENLRIPNVFVRRVQAGDDIRQGRTAQ
jgi:hypothetical protein